MKFPTITIGLVKGGKNYFEHTLQSVQSAIYASHIPVIIIENVDRKKSIGRCYNEIAQKADTDWVMYVGADGDYIVREYLFSLAIKLNEIEDYQKRIACVTTYCTLYSFNNGIPKKLISNKIIQGMWNTAYLLDEPFNENLLSCVDADMFSRVDAKKNWDLLLASHQYGYYYHQHDSNISGNKFSIEEKGGFKTYIPVDERFVKGNQ